jgi:hypothetical protein
MSVSAMVGETKSNPGEARTGHLKAQIGDSDVTGRPDARAAAAVAARTIAQA